MSGPVTHPSTAGPALDQRFALDVQSVEGLRRAARLSPEEGLRQVSRQFEALFMGMLLKSMRDATPSSGLLDGQGSKVYLSMLDQQMAQHLSGRGMKLADAMFAQLRRSLAAPAAATEAAAGNATAAGPAPAPVRTSGSAASAPAGPPAAAAPGTLASLASVTALRTPRAAAVALPPLPAERAPEPVVAAQQLSASSGSGGWAARVQHFVGVLGDSARAAAASTGLAEQLILAQAALESAWGRREVRSDDGGRTFNVFGIKADRGWRGRSVEAATTEVIDGVAHRVRARFRAYGSYQEAFADYAGFLAGNPRYAKVFTHADPAQAARELQRAGYATDPDYAGKLIRVMKRLGE